MNTKQYLTSLTIIHLALMMGQVLFAGVAFFLNSQGGLGTEGDSAELGNLFLYLVPVMAVSGIGAAMFIPRMRLPAIQQKTNLEEKLQEYRSVLIMKYALMEAPSLLALVAYLLTGELVFLGIAGLIIVLFVFERPSASKIALDLALNSEEKSALGNLS